MVAPCTGFVMTARTMTIAKRGCISIIPLLEDARSLLADQAQLVEQRTRLETIADIAIDYDGYRTAEDLMSLIDEMRDIALRGVPEEVTVDAD